jgi:hypothetical protein
MQRFPVKRFALLEHAKKMTEEQGSCYRQKMGAFYIEFLSSLTFFTLDGE